MKYTGKGLHVCLENCHMVNGERVFTKGNIYLFDKDEATNDAGRSGHGVSHGSWGDRFTCIENAKPTTLKHPYKVMEGASVDRLVSILKNTNMPMLQRQKITLIGMDDLKKSEHLAVTGVIHFLDAFQDMLVDDYNVSGEYIFNSDD